ncbi:fibulin 1/2 [Paragonimus westermani]|uniref:Fibulin 1/2 n=1 Tax=Paragonimus westermani TaxID=34504 RepID=A0A5J4P0Y8_9TREM|nr:fibulin 1/2 [Paragonimus westermani]
MDFPQNIPNMVTSKSTCRHTIRVFKILPVIWLVSLLSQLSVPVSTMSLEPQPPETNGNEAVIKNTNSESLFHTCCSMGQMSAHSMDFLASDPNKVGSEHQETCSSVLQLDLNSPVEYPLQATENSGTTLLNERDWCERVKHLCCLSSRRVRACHIGSDHVVRYGGRACSDRAWNTTVEKQFQAVAKECCLCRIVWVEDGSSLDDLQQTPFGTKHSACPGAGCCDLLKTDTSRTKAEPKRRSIGGAELEVSSKSSIPLPNDKSEDFDFSFVGTVHDSQSSDSRVTATEHPQTVNTTEQLTVLCRENYVWDKDQELCILMMTACPIGMYLNKTTNRCAKRLTPQESCATGYRLNETSDQCEDIDECREGSPTGGEACVGEGMQCVNLQGSFKCVCEDGFTMADDGTCVDVNECKADPLICGPGMMCINVRGGHKCVDQQCPGRARRDKHGNCVPCSPGYVFNATTGACDGEIPRNVNECEEGTKCKPWERCVNHWGYFVCEPKINCDYGTRINANGTECEDIDECAEKLFNCGREEMCVNTNGSYTCVPSPCAPTQILECYNTFSSHFFYSFQYETKTCVCEKGWKDVNGTCEDINECEEASEPCPPEKTCVNHPGGYRCIKMNECPSGFERQGQFGPCTATVTQNDLQTPKVRMYVIKRSDSATIIGRYASCDCTPPTTPDHAYFVCIVDIDECKQNLATCNENMYCLNTVGSYQCLCKRGYKNLDEKTCVDVDECLLFGSESACPDPRARCVNSNGSHLCVCPEGFTWLDYPTSKCTAILSVIYSRSIKFVFCQLPNFCDITDIDECALQPDICGKEHKCVNLDGSYKCVCAAGYQNAVNQKSCVDVDECTAHLHQPNGLNLCPHSMCVNRPGSYKCQCPGGFRLGQGGRCYGNSCCLSFVLDSCCFLHLDLTPLNFIQTIRVTEV